MHQNPSVARTMNRLARADELLKAALTQDPSDLLESGWYDEAREYVDGLESVETVLLDLLEYIELTRPKDEHGHELRDSRAYLAARRLAIRWREEADNQGD